MKKAYLINVFILIFLMLSVPTAIAKNPALNDIYQYSPNFADKSFINKFDDYFKNSKPSSKEFIMFYTQLITIQTRDALQGHLPFEVAQINMINYGLLLAKDDPDEAQKILSRVLDSDKGHLPESYKSMLKTCIEIIRTKGVKS